MTNDNFCLHCSEGQKVQVSCDVCHSFICVDCHWCHEFQANHEIRVCDRCDSFLCKECEDMDQCHDCGEVVCKSCGTLLTCKFCGSALCEECATACAKCGIVLCGRDAKFAVDCDTCKLSYCLVCLASGQKDACIRCHARPSKRMEQLVHLRLKSIYKAFQQSARNNDAHPHLKRAALAAMKNSNKNGEPKIDPVLAKAQADAAAAELLAELEEEEEQQRHSISNKSNKKKKKKKKKGKGAGANNQEVKNNEENKALQEKKLLTDEKRLIGDERKMQVGKKSQGVKSQGNNAKKIIPHAHQTKLNADKKDENVEKHHENKSKVPHQESPIQYLPDPMQTKLSELVSARDMIGIEELLDRWKGVPGKSVLRKNAKKALKRLRDSTVPSKKQLLKIISTTPKTSTTQETVLEMSPEIVGHVIGKEGQKVRSLMEESGAKVWIDQESMKVHDPRIVYVSGAKKAVNVAVKMIQDSVKQVSANELQREEDKSNKPVENKTSQALTDRIREEITCDPRFVPLLIGRRGWNIKQIQDGSGAKVDIDQSVTPRSIIVTGTAESVQAAKSLISDVLAYPHAQLNDQAKRETDIEAEFFGSDGKDSPPPSKFITMGGDVKSIISVSSSLSSTPEPSMVSTNKGQEVIMPPPGMFGCTIDRPEGLAQRYAQTSSYSAGHFGKQQAFNELKPTMLYQQPVSKLPHLQPNIGVVGNVQQHQGSLIGQHQHHQAMQMRGLLPGIQIHQPMLSPHNMHSTHGIIPPHEMTIQQQQLQGQENRASLLSHVNPVERGTNHTRNVDGSFGQAHPIPLGQQYSKPGISSTLFDGTNNYSRLRHGQQNQQHPWLSTGFQSLYTHHSEGLINDANPRKNETNGNPFFYSPATGSKRIPARASTCHAGVDISSGLFKGASNSQEESNLIERMFGPSNLGQDSDSILLSSLNHLDIGSPELNDWGISHEKSRLPAMQQPSESRFQWGSS